MRDPLFATVAAGAVSLHAVGLLLAATAMRAGTPQQAAAERAAWLASHPPGWTVGWSVWMLCALSLVALLAVVVSRLSSGRAASAGLAPPGPAPTTLGVSAIALAAAGAGIDLLCDALWITAVPALAREGPDPLFLAAERALVVGGTVSANGLYAIAVLLVSLALPRTGPRWSRARMLGAATFAAGMALGAAGFLGHPAGLAAASALTIVGFIAWTLALARAFDILAPGPR